MKTSTTSTPTRAPTTPQNALRTHQTSQTQASQGTPAKRGQKRKPATPAEPPPATEVVDLTGDTPPSSAKKPRSQGRRPQYESPERRARRWRAYPPRSYLARLDRIRTQRMFVVGHTVGGTDDVPEITFDIVGSTGNLYRTMIGKVPTCDCPDAAKGNQCKHICYVLVNALKAPSHLQYQLAFLSSELREMYHGSPLSRVENTSTENTHGNRKPIEGDCPICFMEFEPKEEVVWCKAACGNNIHKACFEQWAATSRSSGVRCVYCRTAWKFDEGDQNIESLRSRGTIGEDGYINVADQFGLSGRRDYSVYSPFSTAHRSYSYGPRRRILNMRWDGPDMGLGDGEESVSRTSRAVMSTSRLV